MGSTEGLRGAHIVFQKIHAKIRFFGESERRDYLIKRRSADEIELPKDF